MKGGLDSGAHTKCTLLSSSARVAEVLSPNGASGSAITNTNTNQKLGLGGRYKRYSSFCCNPKPRDLLLFWLSWCSDDQWEHDLLFFRTCPVF